MEKRRIYRFEPWFFILFGIFLMHSIWGIIDRNAYADFWLNVLTNKGISYFIVMGILIILCLTGIFTFLRNWGNNYWWRWIYLFGSAYVMFDLVAVATGWVLWRKIILGIFNVNSQVWNLIWSGFIIVGVILFIFGIYLFKQGKRESLKDYY